MMLIDNKYDIGEVIYLSTDEYQKPRVITSIQFCGDKSILYKISCGTDEYWAYDCEICKEKNILVTI